MEATIAGAGSRRAKGRADEARARGFASAAELRDVLDAVLRAVDSDERIGTLIRAASLRLRLEFTDVGLVLSLSPAEGSGNLSWRFGDGIDRKARLRLWMDSATANRFLQGRESLAIAIARGRVRFEGDARAALLYVPAMRLLTEPYRRAVAERAPELVID